jgi:hypothetical protein
MKNLIVIVPILLMPSLCLAQADDIELMGFGADLHGSVGIAWQSKYIWRGFDMYADDNGAAQLTANLDLFGTGFGVNVAGHRANTSGFENGERWDYNLYYANVLDAGEPSATHYRVGFVYYNHAQLDSEVRDLQEMHAILSWPGMTGVKGLVPSYVVVGAWPAHSGSPLGENASGFLHIAMMDFTFAVPGDVSGTPEQVFKLHSEFVFNDGWHPAGALDPSGFGGNVDHDWSNAVLGISTDMDLGFGFTITPSVYYQVHMEDSVNIEDEAWLSIGARYAF